MKKRLLITILTACSAAWMGACNSNRQNTQAGQVAVYQWFEDKSTTILAGLDTLALLCEKKADLATLQAAFAQNRNSYKFIEALVEYYFQGLTKRINGPALPDVKTEDGQVWPPQGYQVVEQYLYDGYTDSVAPTVVAAIRILQNDLRFVKANLAYNAILPHHFFDIVQHQFIRITTLGITGFDAPLSKLSLPEAWHSLVGIEEMAQAFGLPKAENRTALQQQALNYLKTNNNFDSFDRLQFITEHLMPLANSYVNVPGYVPNADSLVTKPFRGTLASFLSGNSFNADYYTNYAIGKSNSSKIALGKRLFFDNKLSKSGTLSWGSCHQPDKYFTDGLAKANNFVHGGSLERNTPSLYYAALQTNQFYDLRSTSLEDQADEVMKNSNEFNLSAAEVADIIFADKAYKTLFDQAYTNPAGTRNNNYEVRNALAAYVRSLSPFNSAFDHYINGNKAALTAEQIQGFNLFAGKAKCATCHFVPLFNGNNPPWLAKSESEIIGVPAKAVWQNATIDPDSGRYKINRLEPLLFAFKTPTVRNAAQTAPYMHNGVYKTLDEVVEFYHRGGGAGIGIPITSQSLPFDNLQLNHNEKKAIVAFMKALTDEKTVDQSASETTAMAGLK
jgi:cytochrome c peroxidase